MLQLYSQVNGNLMDIIFSKFLMFSLAGKQAQYKGWKREFVVVVMQLLPCLLFYVHSGVTRAFCWIE